MVLCMAVMEACKKNTPPEIYLPNITNNTTYTTGDTIHLEITLVDDQANAGLDISVDSSFGEDVSLLNVLPVFSGHHHFPVSGQTHFIRDTFHVPDSVAAGKYEFEVMAFDADGASAAFYRTIILESRLDSSAPVIDSFAVNDTFRLSDNNFDAFIRVQDDRELANLLWLLKTGEGEVLERSSHPLSGTLVTDNYTFPVPSETGSYNFTLVLHDWVNNQKKQTYNIVFVE